MSLDKNPEKIQEMFNEIAQYYDKMNNYISLGSQYLIKIFILKKLNIKAKSDVLDLCCGTGDITKILSKISPKARVIGLDFSKNMLKIAKEKNQKGVFMYGDCTQLPFRKNEFDFVTISFGLRNINNREKAIQEAYRVLKKGGYFMHIDFASTKVSLFAFKLVTLFVAKVLNKDINHYKYLIESIQQYPSAEDIICEFSQNNFNLIKRYNFMFGVVSAQIMQK